jgi:glycosyltransferase involved in cell wall biosynthesis
MKVVHLITVDMGGAYTAALRISNSMQQFGITAKILVKSKRQMNSPVEQGVNGLLPTLLSKIGNGLNRLLSSKYKHVQSDFFGTNIARNQHIEEADIIFIHWVTSFLSYKNIERLAKTKKPVIWVMHDMWLFTGGCHIDQYCGKYSEGCRNCPLLFINGKYDVSYFNYVRKQRMVEVLAPFIIGPSSWIISCASKSAITKNREIIRIPNPIDTIIYQKASDKQLLREKYNLFSEKKIILFSAIAATKDKNKGFQHFNMALNRLSFKYTAIVVGNDDIINEEERKNIIYLGRINNEQKMAEIYNISDVYVAPSEQENYSNSVLEALSCGVPVVAFAIGGMPEIIQHKETGYIAKYRDIDDLATGIEYCIKHNNKLGEKAVIHRNQENSMSVIGRKYADLCNDILENQK